ncbi:hypothetical protein KAU45_09365 [bacterium]|nr:hypothetical protein [bacterium]
MAENNKVGLVRQWPGYLGWGALAALAAVLLQLGADLATGVEPGGFLHQTGDWLSKLAFFALAQALFPTLIIRFKRIPTALGVSLALGGFAGYIVRLFFSLITDPVPFSGQQVFTILFLGIFVGLVTGGGWNIAKGRVLLFWVGFLVACASITAFYHYTSPAEIRESRDVWDRGFALVATYLPVIFVVWWRHRPRGGESGDGGGSSGSRN